MILRKTFRFEASHILPRHPGRCSRLHGHSWVLDVYVEGDRNPKTGFVMDFADISGWISPLIANLDHTHLGTWDTVKLPYNRDFAVIGMLDDFYPTSENLLWWIGERIDDFPWSQLTLHETCTSYASLGRPEYINATHSTGV